MFTALAVALARDCAPFLALGCQLPGCEHELLKLLRYLQINRLAKLRCEVKLTLICTDLVVIVHSLVT